MSERSTLKLLLAERELRLEPGRPLLMGVVNASPESFFDGGRHDGLEAQVEHAHALAREGAELIDVGGQSGVTDGAPIGPDEEKGRVVPLVERLAGEGLLVSVDTWSAEVASAAVAAGAVLVNDVSGLSDPESRRCAPVRAPAWY